MNSHTIFGAFQFELLFLDRFNFEAESILKQGTILRFGVRRELLAIEAEITIICFKFEFKEYR